MLFEIKSIESIYATLTQRVDVVRNMLNRPLTLSEKILLSHSFAFDPIGFEKHISGYMEFSPDRVIMQDATAQMALLQFMLAGKSTTAVPTSVHCDHLILSHFGASEDLDNAINYNREVYDFLRSVCGKYGIDFWKPGAGIIHQVVVENYAFPGGLIIGTDSHTPNAGGLGMIAIGVGGADAVDVMTGMPWELKFPKLLGVKLTGKLNGWTSAKDVILHLAGILTVQGGTGYIIEYFGEGARSLSCTGKSTICNMGAEVGATSSLFGYDEQMRKYLVATQRSEAAMIADTIASYLTGDDTVYAEPEKYFDKVIEINLSQLEPHINGPFTPDRAVPISQMKSEAVKNNWPLKIEVGLIGSCTNSSYQDLSRSVSIVHDAKKKDLIVKSDFIITPGSEMIRSVAEEEGFIKEFESIGGKVFANACGPCIGQWKRADTPAEKNNTIITSFNRNFAKRNDGNANTHAFVASPEIVTALSIAGDLTFNPLTDTLLNSKGEQVKLNEPGGMELPLQGFKGDADGCQRSTKDSSNAIIKVDPDSDRLQLLEPFGYWDGKDFNNLHLLIKVKGKCTTDHISMAGEWLKYRGHLDNISNNFMIGAMNAFNGKTNNILNQVSGQYEEVPMVARYYRSRGEGSLIVGDENYGEGSSREHAAMEPRFLNVKAVLVKSFARIHETNLKKQGVLALTFRDKNDYEKILEKDVIDISGLNTFSENSPLVITLHHESGISETIFANHSYNAQQIEWFRWGSALNLIRANGNNNNKS